VKRWLGQAAETLRLASSGAVLATAAKMEGGPGATATCDQVVAMFRESETWLTAHPCPDVDFDNGLHFYFASISDLIARQELNAGGMIDLPTLKAVIEMSGDFLAWLNEQLEVPLS